MLTSSSGRKGTQREEREKKSVNRLGVKKSKQVMDEEYIWQTICFNIFIFPCSETTARNIIEGHTFVHTSTIYHKRYTVFLLSFIICIFLCPLTSYCYFFQVFNSFGRSLSIYHTNFMYRGYSSSVLQKNVQIY